MAGDHNGLNSELHYSCQILMVVNFYVMTSIYNVSSLRDVLLVNTNLNKNYLGKLVAPVSF